VRCLPHHTHYRHGCRSRLRLRSTAAWLCSPACLLAAVGLCLVRGLPLDHWLPYRFCWFFTLYPTWFYAPVVPSAGLPAAVTFTHGSRLVLTCGSHGFLTRFATAHWILPRLAPPLTHVLVAQHILRDVFITRSLVIAYLLGLLHGLRYICATPLDCLGRYARAFTRSARLRYGLLRYIAPLWIACAARFSHTPFAWVASGHCSRIPHCSMDYSSTRRQLCLLDCGFWFLLPTRTVRLVFIATNVHQLGFPYLPCSVPGLPLYTAPWIACSCLRVYHIHHRLRCLPLPLLVPGYIPPVDYALPTLLLIWVHRLTACHVTTLRLRYYAFTFSRLLPLRLPRLFGFMGFAAN